VIKPVAVKPVIKPVAKPWPNRCQTVVQTLVKSSNRDQTMINPPSTRARDQNFFKP
jgi:hypothetical protein